jgi:RNA recognition motif-containing protein
MPDAQDVADTIFRHEVGCCQCHWRFLTMSTNIYVGNLPFQTTEQDLEELFAQYGDVSRVNIIQDRETGRSRGFGFVEMESEGASEAIEALDGNEFGGRNLRVNVARERTNNRPRRSGGGDRYNRR